MQGGIGKTVISSWLVRQSHVRQTFAKIVWVTLGQTPNIDTLQRVLYEQLVSGGRWDEKAAPDVKTQRMGEAFHGQNVLLVLDDLCEYLGLLFSARSQMQSTADRGDQARNGTELHRRSHAIQGAHLVPCPR